MNGKQLVPLLLVGLLGMAHADVVRLKNGSKFEGVVVRQSPTEIEMNTLLEGSMTFSRAEVDKVDISVPEGNLLLIEQWERKRASAPPVSAPPEPKEPAGGGKTPLPAKLSASRGRDAAETARVIKDKAAQRSDEGNQLLSWPDANWRHRESQHFLVFCQDGGAGKAIAGSAEYHLEKIAYDLNVDLDEVCGRRQFEVFVVSSPEIWKKLVENRMDLEFTTAFFKADKMEIFVSPSNRGYDVPIFAHELGHLVLWLFCKHRPLPLWLHEGFAMYESGEFQFSNQELTKAAKEGRLPTIAELHSMGAYPRGRTARLVFYMQSARLVEYIITQHGRDRFSRFVSLVAEGSALDAALRRSFKGKACTVAGFQEAWQKYLSD